MPLQPIALDPPDASLTIPLYIRRIPAGFPSPADGEQDEPLDIASWLRDDPASYPMRVSGWSMRGAGINDGDIVLVNRAVDPRAGYIVVAVVHGERVLARLRTKEKRFWLVPECEGYEHTLVDEYVELWGVVVALARKYL